MATNAACGHTHGILTLLGNAKPHPTKKGKSIVPDWALQLIADSIRTQPKEGTEV